MARDGRLGPRLHVRLSDRQMTRLQELATAWDKDVSALIRDAIDQAYFLPADGTISTLPGTMQAPVEATPCPP
jgi:hypothetical protein